MDGLEAFFIHGTSSANNRWRKDKYNRRGPQRIPYTDGTITDKSRVYEGTRQLLRLQNSKYFNTDFEWGGVMGVGNNSCNDKEDRTDAANKLVKYIMDNRVEGEDITMIAHSHGGNVAIQAAPLIRAALDKVDAKDVKINLITVNTPAVNKSGDVEAPGSTDAIDNHIHIFNYMDKVQDLANMVDGDGKRYNFNYVNSKVKKIELDVSEYFKEKSTGAHSIDYTHPEFIKENIDNGTIPKIKQ